MELETTKFLLDSGNPKEYKEIASLATKQGSILWGSTTNPSLIAKKLVNNKISQKEAFDLQKEIVLEIVSIVPGAVSAEVYADESTSAQEMVEQGREIATWHRRVVVKLPTTLEGFKARSILRREKIPVNNTLVFSQAQIFAICLHEQIMQQHYGPIDDLWPPFISPFVGRLDDIGENGMDIVRQGMKIKRLFTTTLPKSTLAIWMLAASVRTTHHMAAGIAANTELITAPAKIYREWFALSHDEQEALVKPVNQTTLKPISYWNPNPALFKLDTEETFMDALQSNKLDIHHKLTDKGLVKFADDWKAIIQES